MTTTVIKTKYYIPKTNFENIKRERITNLLETNINKKVILIKAPAGYGKSSIAGNYCKKRDGYWISIGEEDNSIVQFWYNIFFILENEFKSIATSTLKKLKGENPSLVKDILADFINSSRESLESREADPITIVLDDFHLISNENMLETVQFFILNIISGIQFVISTRKEPKIPLSKLRLTDNILEITSETLLFNSEEIERYFKKVLKKEISSEELINISKITEGWIAGIQLAGLSWKSSNYRDNFINELNGSNNYIIDYLIDEVLKEMPLSLKEFLLKTSFLTVMSPDLCNAVLDQGNSGELLKKLKDSNLFIFSLDNNHGWYRYHHLFRELLLTRLESDQELIRELYIRAYKWYRCNNFVEEAYSTVFHLGDTELIVSYLEEVALDYMGKGYTAKVTNWLNALPQKAKVESPILSTYYALALSVTGDPNSELNTVNFWLSMAEKNLDKISEGINRNRLKGYIRTIKSYCSHTSYNKDYNPELLIEVSQSALEILPDDEFSMIALNYQSLFTAYCSLLDMEAAEEAINKANTIGRHGRFSYLTITTDFYISYYHYVSGNILKAESVTNRFIEFWETSPEGNDNPAVGLLYLIKAFILIEKLKYKESEQLLKKALPMIMLTGRSIALTLIHWGLFKVTNNKDEIVNIAKFWLGENSFITYLNGDDLDDGNLDIVPGADLAALPIYFERVHQVKKFINDKKYDQALSVINLWSDKLNIGKLQGRYLELQTLKAVIFDSKGERAEAVSIIRDTIKIAKPLGLYSIFSIPELKNILLQLKSEKFRPDFVNTVLGSDVQDISVPYGLTDREMEVLDLMALGKTNKEIGALLFLSPHTVRTHTVNIYDKIGLRTRLEVVKEYHKIKQV